MPWIERIRTEQPLDAGVGIDWGNPITRGLRVLLNGAVKPVSPWTTIGGVSSSTGPTGVGVLLNGTSQALSMPLDLTNTRAVTVVSKLTPISYPGTYQMFWEFGADGNTTNGGFTTYGFTTSNRLETGTNGGGAGRDSAVLASPRPAIGVPVSVTSTYDHTAASGQQLGLYLDGVQKSLTTSPATGGSGAFGNLTLYVGARTGSTLWANNKYDCFALFDVKKTDAEIKSLSDNPWQLFEKERIWVPVAAGGDTYTLTADSGSFALTGQDTALNFNRTLAADSGSFALTGQAAGLAVNRTLSAASGSYSLTGQNATLTYTPTSTATYTLAAASGSFAVSGQDVVLAYNRVLSAANGSYLLTGQNATLVGPGLFTQAQLDYMLAYCQANMTGILKRWNGSAWV